MLLTGCWNGLTRKSDAAGKNKRTVVDEETGRTVFEAVCPFFTGAAGVGVWVYEFRNISEEELCEGICEKYLWIWRERN